MKDYRRKSRKISIRTCHLILSFTLVSFVTSSILAANFYYVILRSTGLVGSPKPLNVFIRSVWLGSFNSAFDVDSFVAKYPDANGIMLTDGRDNLLAVISYMGWNASATWNGFPYSALKAVIDRFHYHGWKVILDIGFGWATADYLKAVNDPLWLYLNNEHRELNFVNSLGQLRGVEGSDGSGLSDYNYLDYFKNCTTPDTQRNVPAGVRFIDVYTSRFKQMITDGSFEWDGWFGTDGWGGLNVENYFWSGPVYGDGTYVSFSNQEINEWANSNYVSVSFPQSWSQMTNVEKAQWIKTYQRTNWWYYWQERWAQLWHQIDDVFADRPAEFKFGAVAAMDRSSTWEQDVLGPTGMYNFTQMYLQDSFSHLWLQSGGIIYPQENAWAAGLIRSKQPEFHTMTYAPLFNYSLSYTKEIWMSQAVSYVWKNGIRYRAADPSFIGLHADSEDLLPNKNAALHVNPFINWLQSMYNVLGRDDLTPIYLGPTYVMPVYRKGISPLYNLNYTFSQYIDVINLRNQPQNLKSSMGTLLLDMSSFQDSEGLTGLKNTVLNMYANGSLNLILYSGLYDNRFSVIFNEGYSGDPQADSTFHMSTTGQGSSTFVSVLTQSQLTDPNANWIASGYYGNSYAASFPGVYSGTSEFIPIAQYSDGRVSLGIYYNSTSGRLAYIRSAITDIATQLPEAMLNRAIDWASGSPVISSNPLICTRVFNLTSDGTIIMPMMQENEQLFASQYFSLPEAQDYPTTLNINASALGLGSPSNYIIYWQSSNGADYWTPTNWNSVSVTLKGGADILVIKHK